MRRSFTRLFGLLLVFALLWPAATPPVSGAPVASPIKDAVAFAPSRSLAWKVAPSDPDSSSLRTSTTIAPGGEVAVQVSTGGSHTCALTMNGGVKCWGYNLYGQLGDGSGSNTLTPVDVRGLAGGVTAIAAGGSHNCVLTASGGVKCWGRNSHGQLGDESWWNWYTPVDVSGLTSGVVAIAAGDLHTCALTAGGGVKCWGKNYYGQLGDGTTANRNTPVDVNGLASGVTAIAAGVNHTCALMAGGVKCWGYNNSGQLGDGTTVLRLTPVDVSGLPAVSGVTAIAAGSEHTCALSAGGVKCWGSSGAGQLGDGTTVDRLTPVNVSGLPAGSDVTTIAAGWSHTCAVTVGGSVKCWGSNYYGQVGDGTTIDKLAPAAVSGLASGVTAIAAGVGHTCAVMVGGGVKCWGDNHSGQLGDGAGIFSVIPVNVSGLPADSGLTAVASGNHHTCALTVVAPSTGGGVKCWGYNYYGQLGNGRTVNESTPVDVNWLPAASGVTAIDAGGAHTCALTAGGGVKCWGDNWHGQLGDGTTVQRLTPVDVSGLASGVIAIAAGDSHTCALTAGGGVRCWGQNNAGQLGDGTTGWRPTPVDVSGLANGVTAIAAGVNHTCALMAGGVKCWGYNNTGQVGDGTTANKSTPVDVSGLPAGSGVTAIATGSGHTCALTGGGVKCWGYNNTGQVGDGTTANKSTPVDVSGLPAGSDVTAIAAGLSHTCAVTAEGGVRCWGYNDKGQLGDGTTGNKDMPVAVSGLASGVTAIAAGGLHTCALTAGGGVECWGYNEYGQLGDGSVWRNTPVDVIGFVHDDPCARPLPGNMCAYFGDLHSHTSYSDGVGTPWDAYRAARYYGLDFFATTDHDDGLDPTRWDATLTQAIASTVDGFFVALRGFEWGGNGDINILGSKSYIGAGDPIGGNLGLFYDWLAAPAQMSAVAQFVHPNWPTDSYNNLAWNPEASPRIALIEVGNSDYLTHTVKYEPALSNGWHVAPTNNSDTHEADWGKRVARTGIVAPELTYGSVMDALRSRRVFSTEDEDLVLALAADGQWMGSELATAPAHFDVYVSDPSPSDPVTLLELYRNGVLVQSLNTSSNEMVWSFDLPGSLTASYWYARAVQADGDIALTSPVWKYWGGYYDVLIRDNPGDAGGVPSADPAWQSPDIWVRQAPDGQRWQQNPLAGQRNQVYAEVRNAGVGPLEDVDAYFYWASPALGFVWPDSWHFIGSMRVPRIERGASRIIWMPWDTASDAPPHTCLMVRLVSPSDPIRTEGNPKWDNNIAVRNVHVVGTEESPLTMAAASGVAGALSSQTITFDVTNPYADGRSIDLRISGVTFPTTATLDLRLAPALFQEWLTSGRTPLLRNATLDQAAGLITIRAPLDAAIYGLPLAGSAISGAELQLTAPAGVRLSFRISEEIDGEEIGGNLYTTQIAAEPERIELDAGRPSLQVGQNAVITATVTGDGYQPVPDGTLVSFQTSTGTLSRPEGLTVSGRVTVTLQAGQVPGEAIIRASAPNDIAAGMPLTITDEPIAGVSLTSTGPALMGQTTYFTASVTAGSNVTYAWAFGDGATATGATTQHQYAAAGSYSVTLTASNTAGNATDSGQAVIVAPLSDLSITDTPSGVRLGWTDMGSTVARYEIFRSTNPYFVPGEEDMPLAEQLASEGESEVSFTDTDAFDPPGTAYFYVVRPVKVGGGFYPLSNRTGLFIWQLSPG